MAMSVTEGSSSAPSDDAPALLQIVDLVVRYGEAVAIDGLSLEVARGEMVALIGANGAGKTTLLKVLSGVVPRSAGTVSRSGTLAHVPEGRELFGDLSVDDNLRLGAWRSASRDPAAIYDLFPQLSKLAKRRAGGLSGGEKQMVAIGRALMAKPDLLAIDELSQGLAPNVVQEISQHLRRLNADTGVAVLLVEQNARLALGLCSRTYVLETGRVAAHGPSSALARDEAIRRAYLGGHVAS